LPFEGPIEELSLFDLFQLLALSQKTGTLDVRIDGKPIQIFFKGGKIISLKKGDLIRDKKAAKEMIYSILDANKGRFSFHDQELPDGLKDEFKLKIDNLILEASRRIDELAKIKQNLPSKNTVLILSPKASDANSLDLTTEDWEIISYVDGVRSVGDIIDIIGNEYDTKKHIYGLMKAALLAAVEELYEEEEEEIPAGPKQMLLDIAGEFSLDGKFEASCSLLNKIVSLYPDDRKSLYDLALTHIRLGKFAKAKEITTKLMLEPGEQSSEDIGKLDMVLSTILKLIG